MRAVPVALLWSYAAVLGCDGSLSVFARVAGQSGAPSGIAGGAGALAASGGSAGEGDGTGGAGDNGLGGQPDGGMVAGSAGSSSGLWIDDFEDRDTHAESPLGWWYQVNDGTGTQTLSIEPSSGKATGAYALHSQGEAFTGWGAVVGVNFAGESVIDASAFGELRFWAFAEPGTTNQVSVDLIAEGDVRYYAPTLSLGEGWAQYRVPLTDFRGKNQAPLDPTMLQGMQFELGPSLQFALWLDDVELVP